MKKLTKTQQTMLDRIRESNDSNRPGHGSNDTDRENAAIAGLLEDGRIIYVRPTWQYCGGYVVCGHPLLVDANYLSEIREALDKLENRINRAEQDLIRMRDEHESYVKLLGTGK